MLEKCIAFAQKKGEIAKTATPVLLANLASARLYTLAIRTRAGQPKAELQKLIAAGVEAICG